MKDFLLSNSIVYQLWQAPFNEQKIRPVRELAALWKGRALLDIGCGPGINAGVFSESKQYLGLDNNPDYIQTAQNKFPDKSFICHDVLEPLTEEFKPEVMFCSSLLHHFSDRQVAQFFGRLREAVDGEIDFILVDLILPDRKCIARFLAKADRGDFARPLLDWEKLLQNYLTFSEVTPFHVKLGGVVLWELFLLKGRLRCE